MRDQEVIQRGLYADNQGHLVEVVDALNDTVQFVPQGGGFVRTASHASFRANFRPAQLPTYRAVHVEAEWLPDGMRLSAFSNGRRWNGWAMPYLAMEAGQQLCAEMPGLSYDSTRDAFVFVDVSLPEDEQEQVFGATCIDVAGTQVTVYGIGAGSWTWDEADC